MGRREVSVYTCDGCRASATVYLGQSAAEFHWVTLGDRDPYWLCSVCYSAVEWVVRFQGITIPPKVYRDRSGFGLRKRGA